MPKILSKSEQVQRSIITKFRKAIWSKFLQAIKTYSLIEEGDKIARIAPVVKDEEENEPENN